MQPQLIEIRNQQRDSWNKFSGGWKKWEEFNMNFLKSAGSAIIAQLDIQKTDAVLDIASGTGEPALTIASIATGGRVVATDIADEMLLNARKNAEAKGMTNFETIVADVSELPFTADSFDKLSCRFGFMFFPDMQLAASEMFRVLKKDGKMATAVWFTPQKNVWITGLMSVINANIQTPPPPQGAPSMFRCAEPGLLQSILENAGFKNITAQEINGKVRYDDFNHFWTMMGDVAAPLATALSKADEATRKKIKAEADAGLQQYKTEKGLELEYCSLVISGNK